MSTFRRPVTVQTREQQYSATRSRQPVRVEPAAATAVILNLESGLFVLRIGGRPGAAASGGGALLPLIHVAPLPGPGEAGVEVLAAAGLGDAWLGGCGGVVALRAPPEGGAVAVTALGDAATGAALPEIRVERLDTEGFPAEAPVADTGREVRSAPGGRVLPVEVALHVERQGDRRVIARGWVGTPGQRRRIEAFGLRPLEAIGAGDLEYMGYGPGGRRTPWVSDAKLCGTRGRGMPLTGFAIRLAPSVEGRYDIVYEGSFFDTGVSAPCRNGEPCLPAIQDDPLEAIRVRIVERRGPAMAGDGI